MRTDLSDSFGIDFALFAFNYQPDVVIEVCKAGGLGVRESARSWLDLSCNDVILTLLGRCRLSLEARPSKTPDVT